MSIKVSHTAAHALVVMSALLFLVTPAAAQHTGATSSDTSWIVPRVALTQARKSLSTRDTQAAVLLMDTTLVLQFSDKGISRMNASVRDSLPKDLRERLIARMVGSALVELFDHGIAYNLRALRAARVDGNRLVLEDRAGKRVFDRVEINGRDVMNDFSPAEAESFAAAVNAALRK